MFANFFALTVLLVVGSVKALEPYQLYAEGSCSNIQAQRARNINLQALEGMRLVTAGSMYHLLRQASPHPRYSSIGEDELYYGFCMKSNATSLRPNDIVTVRGFGRPLASFEITPARDPSIGSYAVAVPRDSFPSWDVLRAVVTLTDNENFMFLVTCWTGSDQVGWDVLSRTPTLDENSKKMIVKHAKKLGFNEDNFVFLNHEKCQEQEERERNQRKQNQRQRGPQGPVNSNRGALNVGLGPKTNLVRPEITARINSLSRGPQGLTLADVKKVMDVEEDIYSHEIESNRRPSRARGGGKNQDSMEEKSNGSGRRGSSRRSSMEDREQEENRGWSRDDENPEQSNETRRPNSRRSSSGSDRPEEESNQGGRRRQSSQRSQDNDRNSNSNSSGRRDGEDQLESSQGQENTRNQKRRPSQQREGRQGERNSSNQQENQMNDGDSARNGNNNEGNGWGQP